MSFPLLSLDGPNLHRVPRRSLPRPEMGNPSHLLVLLSRDAHLVSPAERNWVSSTFSLRTEISRADFQTSSLPISIVNILAYPGIFRAVDPSRAIMCGFLDPLLPFLFEERVQAELSFVFAIQSSSGPRITTRSVELFSD